jgi:surface polysaccharide O-acyltransferase-like enzyme
MKKYIFCDSFLIYSQQDATLHSLFYLETALHVSGGTIAHHQERKTTVSTAYGICHTVIATCR